MMKCRVAPDKKTCNMCLNVQISCNVVEECSKCQAIKDGFFISAAPGNGFIKGPTAIVIIDGKIREVSIDQVFDIKAQ